MSLSSINRELTRQIEPDAPAPSKRLQALQKRAEHGFWTTVRINPLFPLYPDGYYTDPHFDHARPVKPCNFFAWEMLEVIAQHKVPTVSRPLGAGHRVRAQGDRDTLLPHAEEVGRPALAIIETPGKARNFQRRIAGLVIFAPSWCYADKAAFACDRARHLVDPDDVCFGWRQDGKPKWAWPIRWVEVYQQSLPPELSCRHALCARCGDSQTIGCSVRHTGTVSRPKALPTRGRDTAYDLTCSGPQSGLHSRVRHAARTLDACLRGHDKQA